MHGNNPGTGLESHLILPLKHLPSSVTQSALLHTVNVDAMSSSESVSTENTMDTAMNSTNSEFVVIKEEEQNNECCFIKYIT